MRRLFSIIYKALWVIFLSPVIQVNNLWAQTEIPAGNISGTWAKDNSPYQINGHITVPNDSILTIEPGVIVLFNGSYKMDVKGCVLAVGTVADTISFTAENHSVGWQGVKFLNTASTNDTSRFVFCKMEYGKLDKGTDLERVGGSFAVMNFSKLVISHCLMQNNTVVNTGNEMSGTGGAIALWNASIKITDNTIIHNHATGSASTGGAIMCWANSNAVISGNRISGNKATLGGGFYIGASAPILTNNIITYNQASYRAGGLRFYQGAKPVLINNTIAFNKGGDGGGINCIYNSDPVLINTILYGNTGTNGNQVCILSADSDPDFVYCMVEGGKEGFGGVGAGASYEGLYENNVSADPDFVNAGKDDFRLSDDSPCISTGADSIEVNNKWYYAPAIDYKGNPRPSPANTTPDKGAIENSTGYTGLFRVPKTNVNEAQLFQNYPNPFSTFTEIPFSLPACSWVKLLVIDCLGREVKMLLNEKMPPGEHRVSFDARELSEGLFLMQLMTENGIQTRKCLHVDSLW